MRYHDVGDLSSLYTPFASWTGSWSSRLSIDGRSKHWQISMALVTPNPAEIECLVVEMGTSE